MSASGGGAAADRHDTCRIVAIRRDAALLPSGASNSRLLDKLGCRDRAQLVVVAYETGVTVPGQR